MHSDGHYLRSITSNQGKKVQFKLWNQWSNQKGRYVDFSCAPGSGRLNHKIEPHRIHPGRARTYLPGQTVGTMEFFALLYIAYEIVSILKNMSLCGLPVKKVWRTVKKALSKYTNELPTDSTN